MSDKLLLIINPVAGKMKVRGALFDLVNIFNKSGYETTVFLTQKKSDAANIITPDLAYNLIVCCGGDGTLNETVSGLAQIDLIIPLGYVPMGTTNDFAATLNIPSNPVKAAEAIINGRDNYIDIGAFNSEKFFTYIAAFGLFTSVSYTAPQEMKKAFGPFAYILEGIKHAIEFPVYKIKLEYDNNILEDEFVFGMISNSKLIAGFMKLNETYVDLNDGKFEVMLIKNPPNLAALGLMLMGLTTQQYDNNSNILFFQASSIKVSCETPVAWCLDGEDGGTHNEIEITNLHSRIIMRV